MVVKEASHLKVMPSNGKGRNYPHCHPKFEPSYESYAGHKVFNRVLVPSIRG